MCLPWNTCRLRLSSVPQQYALLTAKPSLQSRYNLTLNSITRNILQNRNLLLTLRMTLKEKSSENNEEPPHDKVDMHTFPQTKKWLHAEVEFCRCLPQRLQLPQSVGSIVGPPCKQQWHAWNKWSPNSPCAVHTQYCKNVREWKIRKHPMSRKYWGGRRKTWIQTLSL